MTSTSDAGMATERASRLESTLDWAHAYAKRGWSVIPLRPRDKRPMIAWTAYQQQCATDARIGHWFSRPSDANLAIVTGGISGLLVLDVDVGHGGRESLARLERQLGALPFGPAVATGGGGLHLYFAHPGGHVANRAAIAPGLDVRCDGGYVVAPPSIHPSGNPYRWVDGRRYDQVRLPPMPEWLRRLCGIGARRPGHHLEHWRQLAARGVEQGARNNSIAAFTGHLLWHGVDPEVTLQLMLAWNRCRCHPPLSDLEVAQVVASIARLHARDSKDEPSTEPEQ
jgi:hypothetical protein